VFRHASQIGNRGQLRLIVEIDGGASDVAGVVGYSFEDWRHLGN
jgi:hypothetical protein